MSYKDGTKIVDLYYPYDNDEMRRIYESWEKGSCGPAALAVVFHMPVHAVINLWPLYFSREYKGWATLKDIKVLLEKKHLKTKRKIWGKQHGSTFPEPSTEEAIVRIQWLKMDGTEYYWREASKYTHLVTMKKIDGEWYIFCNGTGWFKKDQEKKYLKLGYVTSYIEVDRYSLLELGFSPKQVEEMKKVLA